MASVLHFLLFCSMFLPSFPLHAGSAISTGESIQVFPALRKMESWKSSSEVYAFGFYKQGNNYAIGIFLNQNPATVFWTLNRNNTKHIVPGVPYSSLELTPTEGRFSLVCKASRLDMFGIAGINKASLENNGNLVLYDEYNNRIWQSFDHPTDTLLPGQYLSAGQSIISRAYENDYSIGKYRLLMQQDGNLVVLPVDSKLPSITRPLGENVVLSFYENGVLALSSGSDIIMNITQGSDPSENNIYRATLDWDGVFRVYSSNSVNINWYVMWESTGKGECGLLGVCGYNAFCSGESGCQCLPGFMPVNGSANWGSGCVRTITEQNCKASGEAEADIMMYKMVGLNQSSTWRFSQFGNDDRGGFLKQQTREACETACLSDCSCEAAFYGDNGECRKQKLPLRYGRLSGDPTILLIKTQVASSSTSRSLLQVTPSSSSSSSSAAASSSSTTSSSASSSASASSSTTQSAPAPSSTTQSTPASSSTTQSAPANDSKGQPGILAIIIIISIAIGISIFLGLTYFFRLRRRAHRGNTMDTTKTDESSTSNSIGVKNGGSKLVASEMETRKNGAVDEGSIYKSADSGENVLVLLDAEFSLEAYPRSFTLGEIRKMTASNQEIGRGGYGVVYKGVIADSHGKKTLVAVKRLVNLSPTAERGFRDEINVIGRTHHRNIVRLIGYCDDEFEKYLVYEFMPNGSLASRLYDEGNRLSWNKRIQIVDDIVDGILYLHDKCRSTIIHCDIKPDNILLDDQMRAKIADFGLVKLLCQDQSKTMTAMKGTSGYIAPEWKEGKLAVSSKVDVYSFGVVLLEIICHRKWTNSSNPEELQADLKELVQKCFNDENDLAQLETGPDVDKESLKKLVKIGILCIQADPDKRPAIKEVYEMLAGKTIEIGSLSDPCSISSLIFM